MLAQDHQLSRMQASKNPFMRTLGMFMSGPNAYYRAEKRAIRQYFRGETDFKTAAKKVVILHVVLPSLFQYIANGFYWDDEDQERAALLGSLNGFLLLGDILETALANLTGARYSPEKEVNFAAGITDLFTAGVESFQRGEFAWADILDAMGMITGVPVETARNIAGGVEDIAEGDVTEGVKRVAGYTEKTALKPYE